MVRPRGRVVIAVVVVLAVAQVAVEDVIVFLGATGAIGPGVATSPYLLVGVPFGLFLLLAGTLWAWALTGEDPRR